MADVLLSQIEQSVGYLYLNRPDVHNAISRSMWDAIPIELEKLKNKGARLIVIAGKGPSFAAGADFKELRQIKNYSQAKDNWQSIANCLNAVSRFSLPTIAMIQGNCMGGGLLLAIACDLRYAADNASFALPIARLGIVLDDGNINRLVSLVGPSMAKEIIYLARVLTAKRALQIGLVNDCMPETQLEQSVELHAQEIIKNSASTIEEAKLSCGRACARASESLASTQDESAVVNSYLSEEFLSRLESLG